MSISENIAAIRQQIALAAERSGRTAADITLVGASKMNDTAACREAIAAGIDALGENRVQEMTQKLAENAYDGAPLHFIGHLQRNKVKQVVGKAALIQSVGSVALLDEIEDRRKARSGAGHPAGGEHRRRGGQERLCPRGAGGGRPLCKDPVPCAGVGADDHSAGGKRAAGKSPVFCKDEGTLC